MTVCIAAICDKGRRIVASTDGALSLGGVTSDVIVAGKMYWFTNGSTDWLFLYAGDPSNIDLVLENIRHTVRTQPDALTRENIQITVHDAFHKFVGDWSADRVLSPYNMSMDDFKKRSRHTFGDERAAELSRKMSEDVATWLQDQLLVVGWGKSELSAMLYESGVAQRGSHALAGAAAIGSGAEVALSTLLLLGHSRDSSLEETIYAVASAKFMAEKSADEGVGHSTAMFVTHKRTADDGPAKAPGYPIDLDELKQLHTLWDKHGRPKIPDAVLGPIVALIGRLGVRDYVPSGSTLSAITRASSQPSEP